MLSQLMESRDSLIISKSACWYFLEGSSRVTLREVQWEIRVRIAQ